MTNSNYQKTIQWYEKNAKSYANKTKILQKDLDQLIEFCKYITPKAKVLDVGCGAGRDVDLFQNKGFLATGVDISINLITEAKKKYPNANFIIGDILNLPFENSEFDAVWAHGSIVHFDNKKDILKSISEINRVLKNNGKLHLLVKSKSSQKTDSISKNERFYNFFTQDEISRILKDKGFKIIKIEEYFENNENSNRMLNEKIGWILVIAKKLV